MPNVDKTTTANYKIENSENRKKKPHFHKTIQTQENYISRTKTIGQIMLDMMCIIMGKKIPIELIQ